MENKEEIVESLESKQTRGPGILLVGTHQGASLVMANLVKDFKQSVMETTAALATRPTRGYQQKKKKGRS